MTIRPARLIAPAVVAVLALAVVGHRFYAEHEAARLERAIRVARGLVEHRDFAIAPGQVKAIGGRLLIAVAASVFEEAPCRGYVWRVGVRRRGESRESFARRFDHRMYRYTPRNRLSTPLIEILEPGLSPGQYRVEIALMRVSEGHAVESLDDPAIAARAVVVRDEVDVNFPGPAADPVSP